MLVAVLCRVFILPAFEKYFLQYGNSMQIFKSQQIATNQLVNLNSHIGLLMIQLQANSS